MKILDAYILKRYLSTFAFVVAMLTVVLCAIDFTEHNDFFIERKPALKAIIFDYYLNFIPYILNLISPIVVFIATILVTARMASHSEIIAMLSGGISFLRILVPFMVGATFLGLIIFYVNGWLLPPASKTRVAFELKYFNSTFYYNDRNVHLKIAPTCYAYLESYNNMIHEGYMFTLEEIEGNDLRKKLKAERIKWEPEVGKWRVLNYSIQSFQDSIETFTAGEQLDTLINLSPEDFENKHLYESTLTVSELDEYIKLLKERGAESTALFEIEKQARYAYPFTIIMLTVIGVIVASRRAREGIGFKIAFGFTLAFAYILLFMLGKGAAQAGTFTPVMGVWLPNFLFLLIGLFMYWRVPK
jgi:lipopolysaccharide export system permease protein